jgi:hypothetical protein
MGDLAFPLYFNHVPKCAGTSLNEVLTRGLHRTQIGIEPFVSALHLYNLDAAALDRLMIVGSHFPHWAAARRLPEWSTLTVLRDPWSRFQALTRHLFRIAGSEPQSLTAFQTQYVAMLREARYRDALRQALAWYPFDASMTSCFLPHPVEGAFPSAPDAAIRVLEAYDVVLLADRVDHDSVLLDQALNGQSFGAQARLNTSRQYQGPESGPYPRDMQQLFHALFPYEQVLYAAGAACYERTVEALAGQAKRTRSSPAVSDLPQRAMYTLDWDAPQRCGGFSDRVMAASYGYAGQFARRVEAQKAVLEFEVPRACDARLEAVFWIAPFDARLDCRVTINGEPLTLFDTPQEVGCPADPSQAWAFAAVPRTALGNGHCRLEIERGEEGPKELWLLDLAVRPAGRGS